MSPAISEPRRASGPALDKPLFRRIGLQFPRAVSDALGFGLQELVRAWLVFGVSLIVGRLWGEWCWLAVSASWWWRLGAWWQR